MSDKSKKVAVGNHDDSLVARLHPKVESKPELQEAFLSKALQRYSFQKKNRSEDNLECKSQSQLEIEIEPELVDIAEKFMADKGLPSEDLSKVILLVMEGYAFWLREETRDYLLRQMYKADA